MRASQIDADYVIRRLDEAYQTMIAVKVSTKTPAAAHIEAPETSRTASAAEITAMDEANGWLAYIPNRTIRKIVALRTVRKPHRALPVYSWRKIGEVVKASDNACRAWHAKGIEMIVSRLRRLPEYFA